MMWALALVGTVAGGLAAGGCAVVEEQTMPRCEANPRLAIVAQAVPGAAYVPCIATLPAGWSFEGLDVADGGATFTLTSDRADHDVQVELAAACDVEAATPVAPSDAGVRTYNFVESIDPRYAGRLFDVFPGGCVISSYDFERGPHVTLVAELQEAVGLLSRRELRQGIEADLGVRLDR